MKKKNSNNQTKPLSPENYIRLKSRNLPIGDCFINKDWEESGMCSIAISRNHITGNITFCMYLVDLSCLGVKDCFYKFNVIPQELQEVLDKNAHLDFIKVSYNLVHNLIFAGIEFAEQYDFMPHKDFTKITQYFLEEDDDKIPLMEIKCGLEGKPHYVNSGNESPIRQNQILAQLDRIAGKGNYHFTVPKTLSDYPEDSPYYREDRYNWRNDENEWEDDDDYEEDDDIVYDVDYEEDDEK